MRRASRRNQGLFSRNKPNLAELALVEELTVEKRLYSVALKNEKAFRAAYREGHQWFTEKGALVAKSAQIASICVPARRF